MGPLSVHMFGKFCVRQSEKPVNGLDACKLQELFSYILVFRESPHSREELAALLWGDSSTAQSKKYLRQALWQIQSVLSSRADEGRRRVFNVEADWISFNAHSEIWLDVALFEQAFSLVREVAGHQLDAAQAQTLGQAIQLYQGDLLEGWYQDWCLCERERLQTNYLIMLDKMMSYCEAHEKYETALTYGMRVLRYDRARESTHRRLMHLHYLAGDRTAALRQYQHCVGALNEELGVKPSRLTVALYDQIRLDEFQASVARPVVSPTGDLSVLPTVIDHLRNLRQVLIKIHGQVHKDIKAVEQALDEWK
jgi:DNA-binding SARP family transcriptional activator